MEEIGLIFGVPVRSPKLLGIGKYAAAPDRYSLLLSMKSRLSSVFGDHPKPGANSSNFVRLSSLLPLASPFLDTIDEMYLAVHY